MTHAKRLPCSVAQRCNGQSKPASSRQRLGFTLVELLVVTAITAILAALLVPAVLKGRRQGLQINCLSNLKQLQTAWTMYADDYRGNLAPNPKMSESSYSWVPGNVAQQPDSTNTAIIQNGLLYPYIRTVDVYRCPQDDSPGRSGLVGVRSYSMNCYMNGTDIGYQYYSLSGYTVNRKISQIILPPPSLAFVFVEESQNSIDDGQFSLGPSGPSGQKVNSWLHFPTSRHNNGAGFSFADGHCAMMKWKGQLLASLEASSSPMSLTASEFNDLNHDLRNVQAGLARLPGQYRRDENSKKR